MSGSTRTCVTILNLFGGISMFAGALFTANVLTADEVTSATIIAVVPGLASILSGALLAGAAEALRLLSEIRDSLIMEDAEEQRIAA